VSNIRIAVDNLLQPPEGGVHAFLLVIIGSTKAEVDEQFASDPTGRVTLQSTFSTHVRKQ